MKNILSSTEKKKKLRKEDFELPNHFHLFQRHPVSSAKGVIRIAKKEKGCVCEDGQIELSFFFSFFFS